MQEEKLFKMVQVSIEEHGVAEIARRLKVSPSYLHDVITSRRRVGKKLVGALGYEQVVTYRKVQK